MRINMEELQIEQRESIKLIKNTKGFNWELKILNTEGKMIDDSDIRRLDVLNKLMEEKYGKE
jgi:hypothetical protein